MGYIEAITWFLTIFLNFTKGLLRRNQQIIVLSACACCCMIECLVGGHHRRKWRISEFSWLVKCVYIMYIYIYTYIIYMYTLHSFSCYKHFYYDLILGPCVLVVAIIIAPPQENVPASPIGEATCFWRNRC